MVTFQGGFCVIPMCDILLCFYYSVISCVGWLYFCFISYFYAAASFIESMCFINVT